MAYKFKKYNDFSFIEHLIKKKKISRNFLTMLNGLTLEELISLKLECTSKVLKDKFFCFGIWKNLDSIIYESVLRYALLITQSREDLLNLLELDEQGMMDLAGQFDLGDDFIEKGIS